MHRMMSYIIAGLASAVGWKLGSLVGPAAAYFTAVFFAGAGLYLARRWFREILG